MKNKQHKKTKLEPFKLSPSGMGYVELYDNEVSTEVKDALRDLIDDAANSTGQSSSSATIDDLQEIFEAMRDKNVTKKNQMTPAETLLKKIVKQAKQAKKRYDELTFNWS